MPFDATIFRLTARQNTLARLASGVARYLLVYGGSRSGKTFMICWIIITRALKAPGSRHLVMRKTLVAAKQALAGQNGTISEVLRMAFPGCGARWYEQDARFSFPNGAEIWLGGLDSANLEKVLGNEYATIYQNEASELPFSTHEVLETRLAQVVDQVCGERGNLGQLAQRMFIDLNPTVTSHWTYRLFVDGVNPASEIAIDLARYANMVMNPMDNRDNLSADYLASLDALSDRARKRFRDGVFAADLDEALWRRGMIRRTQRDITELRRIVVAIDPAVSNEPGSNETGIVAMGIEGSGQSSTGYVLADDSGILRPEDWARRAIALHDQLDADCIVAEVNQGGNLVESQIRAMTPSGHAPIRFKAVHATRGKYVRAEPIAGLYERGRMFHAGDFPELEDQMCSFTVDMDRKAMGVSPDRLDAMVWAGTELFGDMTKKKPRASGIKPPAPVQGGWMR